MSETENKYDLDTLIRDLHVLDKQVTKQEKERADAAKHILSIQSTLQDLRHELLNFNQYITDFKKRQEWNEKLSERLQQIDSVLIKMNNRYKFLTNNQD